MELKFIFMDRKQRFIKELARNMKLNNPNLDFYLKWFEIVVLALK